MASCGECKLKIDRNDYNKIECAQCKRLFHAICVNINPADIEFLKNSDMPWKCLSCENNYRKLRLNSSPPLAPKVTSYNSSSQQLHSSNLLKVNSSSAGSNKGKSIDSSNEILNQNDMFKDIVLKKLNNIENQNQNLNEYIQKLNLDLNNLLLCVGDIQNDIKNL